MNVLPSLGGFAVGLCLFATSNGVLAQVTGPPNLNVRASPESSEASDPAALADLSRQMAETATVLRDPILLAKAAQLRLGAIGSKPVDDLPPSSDPRQWLVQAELLANGDPLVLDVIKRVRSNLTRGSLGDVLMRSMPTMPTVSGAISSTAIAGPMTRSLGPLLAGGQYEQAMRFRGQAPAIIYVEGSISHRLKLTILDQRGAVVCQDNSQRRAALCRWRPSVDSTYTIKVEVLSGTRDRIVMINN